MPTPSIVAVSAMLRRSSRAHKPNPKFADPAAQAEDVALPLHPSTDPIDARLWSIPFLKRQNDNNKQWFRHLDFVRMGAESIKSIFWTENLNATHGGAYVDPPLALRRDPKTLKDFFRLGTAQKKKKKAKIFG